MINPNRLDETSPHGALAAVGVAFLLVVAVNRRCARPAGTRARPEPDLLQWLDLVALGTVCDVVPLTGINRALVAQGLRVGAAARAIPGCAALAAIGGVTEPIDAYHLGFVLGPRVNAGGRVGARRSRRAAARRPTIRARPRELAPRLDGYNRERREIEARDAGGGDRGGRGRPAIARSGVRRGGGLAPGRHRHRRGAAEGTLSSGRPASSRWRTGSARARAARCRAWRSARR